MANNKLHGYNPKPSNNKNGNRLDKVNPHEFRKGMDYELMELGCDRLAESTPEERMITTETVLKNLNEHPAYYSGLVHYETQFRNETKKPAFKNFIKSFYEDTAMVPLTEKDKLKEAIKTQIKKSILKEDSDKEFDEFDFDDKKVTKAATKAGGKKGKGIKGLDKEIEALEKEKDGLKSKMNPLIQAFNDKKKGKKPYTKEDYTADLEKIKTSEKSSVYSGTGNDHVTDRIKAINKRLVEIEKEKDEIILKEKIDRRAVAETVMDRGVHKGLLNIIQENGISLQKGANSIKTYYEIAKTAYMEGLSAGLRSDTSI